MHRYICKTYLFLEAIKEPNGAVSLWFTSGLDTDKRNKQSPKIYHHNFVKNTHKKETDKPQNKPKKQQEEKEPNNPHTHTLPKPCCSSYCTLDNQNNLLRFHVSKKRGFFSVSHKPHEQHFQSAISHCSIACLPLLRFIKLKMKASSCREY